MSQAHFIMTFPKWLIFSMTLMIWTGSSLAQEDRPQVSLLVFSSKGAVKAGDRIIPAAQRDMRNFESKLDADEVVKTGADGQVQLGIFAEANVLLGPKTEIRVSKLAARVEEDSVLEVLAGRAFFKIKPIREGEDRQPFRLKTPTMTIAVRGTEFFVNVSEEAEVVGTHQGLVEVDLLGKRVPVPAGRAVDVSGGKPQLRNLTEAEMNLARVYRVLKIPVLPRARIEGKLKAWAYGDYSLGWDRGFTVPRAASADMVQLSMEPSSVTDVGRVAALRADGEVFVFQPSGPEVPDDLEPVVDVQAYPKGFAVLTESGVIRSWGQFEGAIDGVNALQCNSQAVVGIHRDRSIRGITEKGVETLPDFGRADFFGKTDQDDDDFVLVLDGEVVHAEMRQGVVMTSELRVAKDWVEVYYASGETLWIDRAGRLFSSRIGQVGENARKVIFADYSFLWMDSDLEWHSPKMDRFRDERTTFPKLVSGAIDIAIGKSRFYTITPTNREEATRLVEEEWQQKLRQRGF